MAKLSDGQFKGLFDDLNMGSPDGGGFSVNAFTGESPSTGVMVSHNTGEEQVPASEASPERLQQHHSEAMSNRMYTGNYKYFGGWNPGGGEDVSLDRSMQVGQNAQVRREYGEPVAKADAMTSALDIGIAQKQMAVFDNDAPEGANPVKMTGYDRSKDRS